MNLLRDLLITGFARLASGGINLVFILLTTHILELAEFGKIVPYSVILAVGMPIINNGSSEIYHTQKRGDNEYWWFSWYLWFATLLIYVIILTIFLYIKTEWIFSLNFAFVLLTIEIFSRYIFDKFLRYNSVFLLEKRVLMANILSLTISVFLLYYLRSWIVLIIRPLVTSVLRIFFLSHSRANIESQGRDVVGFFKEVKQIFVFNFVSSIVESLDRIFLLFGRVASSQGTIERAGTFARLSDTTLRIPLFKVLISKSSDTSQLQLRLLLTLLLASVVGFMVVLGVMKSETSCFVLVAYTFFGIAWLLRGTYVNLQLLKFGFLANRVLFEMIGFGIFVVVIYSFSVSFMELELCVFISGLIGIMFWGNRIVKLI